MNNPVKVIVKFFSYIAGKIIAVGIAVAIMILAFLTAMNTMNVQVMVKDAFALRSSVMLVQHENDDVELLDRVFSEEYISENGLDSLTDNKAYNVTNYNQDTDIELKIVWPWTNKVELKVTDVVDDVRAGLVSEVVDASLVKEDYLMDSGEYTVTVVKTEDGWIIEDAVMESVIKPEILFPLPVPESIEVESDEHELIDEGGDAAEGDTEEGETDGEEDEEGDAAQE